MIIEKIKSDGNSKLLLFFAGWAATPEQFAHLQIPEDYDYTICYDYRSLEFDYDMTGYEDIVLVAWSLGVWVAEKIIFEYPANYVKKIAINGTLSPISDTEGIPVGIFEATLRNVTPDGLLRFNRRMYGGKELFEKYKDSPSRTTDELYDELSVLHENISRLQTDMHSVWNKTILSENDRIFPLGNTINAWEGLSRVETIDAPHYPFYIWKHWNEITGC